MNWKRQLFPTLREEPHDAEGLSHKLLLRAGFIRPLAAGIYDYLPLGWRVLKKISDIVRQEMDRIGGQELLLPALATRELWEASGRWTDYGDDMFRLKDRRGRDLCLCPTHEEIIAQIASHNVRSYRDLPQLWYQIQTKFRDEPRPRFGVVRSRAFLMKDSYSLDADFAGLDKSYGDHRVAYERIFRRCGLRFFRVEASGGLMGEGESAEFMAAVPAGEDRALVCPKCQYAANAEVAIAATCPANFPDQPLKEIHTPAVRTVQEVAAFLGADPCQLVKSMLFVAASGPVLVLVAGDDDVSEAKLRRRFGPTVRPATAQEAQDLLGASLGFLGPVGATKVTVYADRTLEGATGRVTGANRDDYHVTGLNLTRDAAVNEYADLRRVKHGEACGQCATPLEERSVLELGHIFKLGTKYSTSLDAMYLDARGQRKPVVMGSYGIGLERIMAAAAEQNADDDGTAWPVAIAPFGVEILPVADHPVVAELERGFGARGVEVLVDDRDETPGVKFKDADLLGLPVRVTVGPRGLARGTVDIRVRRTRESLAVPVAEAVAKACTLLDGLTPTAEAP